MKTKWCVCVCGGCLCVSVCVCVCVKYFQETIFPALLLQEWTVNQFQYYFSSFVLSIVSTQSMLLRIIMEIEKKTLAYSLGGKAYEARLMLLSFPITIIIIIILFVLFHDSSAATTFLQIFSWKVLPLEFILGSRQCSFCWVEVCISRSGKPARPGFSMASQRSSCCRGKGGRRRVRVC